jgi:hypothetical protein
LSNLQSCFSTISAVNNYSKLTSQHFQWEHPRSPLPYNCESCQPVLFETPSGLQLVSKFNSGNCNLVEYPHLKLNKLRHHRRQEFASKTSASAKMDASDWNSGRDPTSAEKVGVFNSTSTFLNLKLLHSIRHTFVAVGDI